ncbi:HEAT repeat domain-containing protein, partial [Streptomyces sp. NPDC058964]
PRLRRMAESADLVRERTSAACAFWRIGGDPEAVLPVLRSAWTENPGTRGTIASCLVEAGPQGAPLWDLVSTELTAPRRHTARTGGYASHGIPKDEKLLRTCREVLRGG